MDWLHTLLSHLQHLDVTSAIVGALGGTALVAGVIKAIIPIPALLVGKVKAAIKAAADKGNLDAPTRRLGSAIWKAMFQWADAELPNVAGPEKMDAILDKLSALPYLGVLVRADRADAKKILQAEFDAMKAEVAAEAGQPVPAVPVVPVPAAQPPVPAP